MKRKVLIISKLIVVAAGFALLLSAVREKKNDFVGSGCEGAGDRETSG